MERYRVLVLGGVGIGGRAGSVEPTEQADDDRAAELRPFIDSCDSVVANLETPLVGPGGSETPAQNALDVDSETTARRLRELGVDAVGLANRHVGERGRRGLEAAMQQLSARGIAWFGAGRTLQEARRPYRLKLPARVGGGELHFHGSLQYSTRPNGGFGLYADENTAGCAPLSVAEMPWARLDATSSDTFQIAFPHWGKNDGWRERGQYRLAHRYLRKDYDLVLGHGSTNLQEVHRKQQRWVVYGLGNGFAEPVGSRRDDEHENGIQPFSFWSVLEVQCHGEQRQLELKLYPVHLDPPGPRPALNEEFSRICKALRSRPARPWRFDNPAQHTGKDEHGFFLSFALGVWQKGQRPSRLEPVLESGDPGDWPTRGPSVEIEDSVMALRKTVGAGMLALSAEERGGESHWLTENIVLVTLEEKRFLAYQYKAHESVLGATICIDKVVSAEFFEEAGVSTPKTVAVDSADTAVEVASTIPGPVVVKPRNGSKSRGVSTGLTTDAEIREAFDFARAHGPEVLVQQHIEASEELRVMASPTEAVAVIRRVLPHVVGDGVSTIQQLIEDKNLQRALNPSLRSGRPIPLDALTHRHLSRNGFSLESVPSAGQTVTVRNVAALSVGADAHQALESSDSGLKEAATAAVGAIPGLGWGGVDLILEEGTQKPYVIEINTNAAYGAALFPTYGQPLNVAEKVWELRQAATPADVRTAPVRPARATRGPLMGGRDIVPRGGITRFSELFTEYLNRANFQVTSRGSGVLNVRSADGKEAWVTNTGFTSFDRSVVWQVMRRHRIVRQLLRSVQVPMPRGRVVTSDEGLRRFAEGRVSRVVAFPVTKPWPGPETGVLTTDEVLEGVPLSSRMWVQTLPNGVRLRVLATPEAAWTVLTVRPEAQPPSEAAINAASDLAVQAMRAVPELRWAAVDVVVRLRRLNENRPGGALVEGLTIAPTFTGDEGIVAGEFDAFARQIVEPLQ